MVFGQAPDRIELPRGGSAVLVRAEVGANGELPVPDDLGEASWWGAGLGAPHGASLMTGHVNWKGQDGPFGELSGDKPGQRLRVVGADGQRWTYRLREITTVHKNELSSLAQRYFAQDGPHRLVLVTCGGRFVGGDEGYDDNVIAVADLVARPQV